MNERLKIGVSGIGSIGFRHARLLSKRSNVEIYLCEPVRENRQAGLALGSGVQATDNFADLLKWPLDAVIVAVPDRFHVEQTEAACKKGIPVLLEKPIAEDFATLETAPRSRKPFTQHKFTAIVSLVCSELSRSESASEET